MITGCANNPLDAAKQRSMERPDLVVPEIGTLSLRDINWRVVTPSTYDNVLSSLENPVIFGLGETDYRRLLLNFNDLQSYIEKQKSIIESYERYYIRDETEE